jgi:hypothetical protein
MFYLAAIIAIPAAVILFAITRRKAKRATSGGPALAALFGLLTLLSTLALTASGFRATLLDQSLMTGFPLLAHVAAGSVFLISLTLWALFRAESQKLTPTNDNLRALLWWIFAISGLVTALTILASMIPLFGAHGLEVLYEAHRWASLLLIVSGIGYLLRR